MRRALRQSGRAICDWAASSVSYIARTITHPFANARSDAESVTNAESGTAERIGVGDRS